MFVSKHMSAYNMLFCAKKEIYSGTSEMGAGGLSSGEKEILRAPRYTVKLGLHLNFHIKKYKTLVSQNV